MIKKLLLSLWLIWFCLINFSYSRYDERWPRFWNGIIWTEFTNVHEQYLTLYVDKDINFKSTKWWTEKDIFAVYAYQWDNWSTAYWFYWNTRWELSAYARDWQRANPRGWKLTYYYVCDDFELPFTNFTWCVEYLYTWSDIQVVNNYLSYVNTWNDIIYWQLVDWTTVSNWMFSPFIAFNIPNKNKSIVFYFKPLGWVSISYNLPYRYSDAYWIDNEYSVKYHIEEFPNSLIWESPVIWWNIDNSNIPISWGYSNITWWYSYMICTNQNVLAYYVRTFWYNWDMCNLQSWGVSDWYYPYWTLLEFCNIYYTFYNIDLTFLNQLYTWHNKNIVCNTPWAYFTWDEPVSIDWSDEFPWVVNGSWEYENQSSRSFLINLSDILKWNFYIPETWNFWLWYLPRYIILWFMGVIFFNFIRK